MSELGDPISSLLSLITQAAKTLVEEYGRILEGACAQLWATLARPDHTILNSLEPSCLRVALTFKIPDVLQEKPSGMHVIEISQRCGVSASKLARILRLLSAKHCFREVARDTFVNNRLSIQLLSANPMYSLGLHMSEDAAEGATKLPEILADAGWGHSSVAQHSAWNRFTNQPKSMFEFWAESPEMRARGDRFGIGMLGWGTTVEPNAIVTRYPWSDLGSSAVVCDLGGGVGAMAMHIARAHPHLQLKLQDIPDRIIQARDIVWPAQCPEAIRENRIEFKAIDFLVESPIEGCDVYYSKNILHAWPSPECITILKGVRKSMKSGSRIILHEYILQTAANDHQSNVRQFKQAPAPLLSNYGAGKIRQYNLDVSLMVLVNSQERTLDEYVQLAKAAGLKFVNIWEFGDMSGMELSIEELCED
ncbi:S-adenosyl-L-methionine-dependent methyltransferase [Mycena rosella]|uniref:S-adenosyl-L-methionine-dependent methyltransferase n=1 Tax=Mycena rosella TaxID=1033263 RepID=A0AAD7GLT9_MYCRO|nr:S-adenosyl-L-methionine-dependent methyltransferase [Mycena rosella]